MNEQIAAIQHFLKHGELRITRFPDIYRILRIDERGHAWLYRNPQAEARYTQIDLTEKELADLASLCFPPKEQ